MSQNEKIERLEHIVGTLIGSLWAAGKLDKESQKELTILMDKDHWKKGRE